MLRFLFIGFLLLHGAIHLLGVVKAFHWGEVAQLTQAIGKPLGVGWGLAVGLFGAAAVLFWLDKAAWPILALSGVVLSQGLILSAWSDAKFGTLANVVIAVAALLALAGHRFEAQWRADVRQGLERSVAEGASATIPLVTEADLAPLPPPVQRYLRYVGVVGRPRVRNVRATFRGEMRGKDQDWFAFTSEQYNFFDRAERFFFMQARVRGLPTAGYHAYSPAGARMQVKVLSLFPVVDLSGAELRRGETVTVFNDLCLLAPAALIDPSVTWEHYDDRSATARFTVGEITVRATLHFNDAGELVDFVSDDRYETNAGGFFRFSTPVRGYRNYGDFRLPGYGEAVWHYPEGAFTYGKFHFERLEYNLTEEG